jgi:hypothetical protein
MSVSYWKAENTIPIEQTSKSVPVLNGLNFSGGQEVRIKVPPTTKFIKPDECYLRGDFKIQLPDLATHQPTRLQLDPRMGGQALIRDIRIYTSAEFGSVLLEEIQGYNSMVSIMRDYDTNDSEKRKRAMTEGATIWIPETRGTLGTTRSECADTFTNPYSAETFTGSDKSTPFTNDSFLTCKLCLPLETGIFRSPKIWANMYTGLEVVITLEEPARCLTQLDNVSRHKRQRLNPVFHSLNGSITAPNDWANNGSSQEFYIHPEINSNYTPKSCGFVVGERINFVNPAGSQVADFSATPVITAVELVEVDDGAGNNVPLIKITLSAEVKNTGGHDIEAGSWFMYSDSVLASPENHYEAKYTFSNVELVVQEVDMGSNYVNDMLSKMKESGAIMTDILSVSNYKYSQNAGDIVANIRLPLNQSRAKAILSQPTDATSYTSRERIGAKGTYDVGATADEDGQLLAGDQFRGISDNLTDYQFVYDGRLQPSRPVNCEKTSSKTSISAQPIIELQKALVQSSINVKSLADFNRNFVIGRALSLSAMGVEGVYDTRNKDFNLQVNYQGTAPSKNHLWNNFVFHLRRIVIKGDNVSVIV